MQNGEVAAAPLSEQKIMLSLPKKFEIFNEARKKSFMALYEAKESGKKVIGTFCFTEDSVSHHQGKLRNGLHGSVSVLLLF